MLPDVINKLSFDFTCTSEAIAQKVQYGFLHFTSVGIDHILQKKLAGFKDENAYRHFDKIEIDLGDLFFSEGMQDEMLLKFERKLEERLQQTNAHAYPAKEMNLTPEERMLELVKTFFLSGDLPWWADKKAMFDIDKELRKLIQKEPFEVRSFFTAHKGNITVLERLQKQCRPATKSFFKDLLQPASKPLLPVTLSNETLAHLQTLMDEHLRLFDHKQKIILELIALDNTSWIDKLAVFECFSEEEIIFVRQWQKGKGKDTERLKQMLARMTSTQLGFLLFQKKEQQAEENKTASVPTNSPLLKKIGGNPVLVQQALKRFSTADIRVLKKKLIEYNRHDGAQKKQIDSMADHPYLTQQSLLSFLMRSSLSGGSNSDAVNIVNLVWRDTRSALEKAVEELPEKERLFCKALLKDGYSGKRGEKKRIQNLLHSLPANGLALIASLLHLKEEEIEQMIASEKSSDSIQAPAKIIIEEAGLCLLAAYLPSFFIQLDYLQNGRFKSKAFAMRAVRLLEYMATGKRSHREYVLQLPKILCGFGVTEAFDTRSRFRKKEIKEADDLLQSVIENWKALKNTSIDGLRTSFLQRKGIVTETEQSWTLQVEKKGFDVLLNSVPWPFATIRLPWMKKMIVVNW